METQRWSEHRHFLGSIYVEERAGALKIANEWRRRDTVWAGSSRLDSGDVGAA